MRVDHIGYAVKNIDKSREVFASLGFSFSEVVEDTSRNLFIQFGEKDGYRIELLSKLDKSKGSPIDNYLKAIGPTPYHFCYSTSNLRGDLEELSASGFRPVTIESDAIAFNNRKVVFLYNVAIGLIELVEEES